METIYYRKTPKVMWVKPDDKSAVVHMRRDANTQFPSWYGLILLCLLVTGVFTSKAQDSLNRHKDTTRLGDFFRQSKVDVSARSIYMSTINEGALTDDQAWAAGIGAGITSKTFHGFQLGFSAYVIYNLWSTDLTRPDPLTYAPNRYEIGLFDMQSPLQKKNLLRLENLYLKYSYSKSSLTVGKMKINSPFINPQDGRMNITLAEGAWLTMAELKKLSVHAGWIWGISPRSTTQWYTVQQSMGIYPMGVTTMGTRANYRGNVRACAGIAMANVVYKPTDRVKLNVWNMLVDNVMNTAMLELNAEQGNELKFYEGAMYVRQDAINNGGNKDQQLTYFERGAQANVVSAQAGIKNKRVNGSLNYTHITGDGRYLMPREWGRDPFYTFMMRERNEGFGSVHAFAGKTTLFFFNGQFKTSAGYGVFLLPDVKNYRLNKYGIPSYDQVNLDISYNFAKLMKGLELRCIAVYKMQRGETYGNLKYVYNKVNMVNITVMADYRF